MTGTVQLLLTAIVGIGIGAGSAYTVMARASATCTTGPTHYVTTPSHFFDGPDFPTSGHARY